jgi:hypothetical protein
MGATRATWPMPFCRTATRVAESQSRVSHGAVNGVCCVLVHNRTQSTRDAAAGSVRARRETSTLASDRSSTRRSMGCRTQATTSCRSAAPRHPATTPPMLPRPMTATVERPFGDEDRAMTSLHTLETGLSRPFWLAPIIAFSREVDSGSREENASNQNDRASVLIPSEPRGSS